MHFYVGTYIELNGQVLPNNSLVTVTNPPTNIVADVAASLRCVTARADCCSDGDTAVAQWYHLSGGDAASQVQIFSIVRGGEGEPLGYAALTRTGIPTPFIDMGIYGCVIPKPGSPVTVAYHYVGLYKDGQGVCIQCVRVLFSSYLNASCSFSWRFPGTHH